MVKASRVQSTCPMCHQHGGMTLLTTTINVPYFGDALESTVRCEACGFRHADFMILNQKDPLRLTYHVKSEEGLHTRVIRSNSGTIRVPEIGFTAEPTPLSESFVSNVEGVLERAKSILLTAMDWHGDDPEKRALLEGYLATWARLAAGTQPFTLILDDPLGNSAIVSDEVERRALTEEEVAQLQTGMVILDADDMRQAAGIKED